jgi:hypothetical protein
MTRMQVVRRDFLRPCRPTISAGHCRWTRQEAPASVAAASGCQDTVTTHSTPIRTQAAAGMADHDGPGVGRAHGPSRLSSDRAFRFVQAAKCHNINRF